MAALGTIATARQLVITNTRRLTFAEFGDPAGTPVVLCHSLPATRLFRHPDDSLTAALGIRLITADRPGVGLSDRQPGRTLLDWAADVNALADALGIGSFAVIGHGAGGPYAAACAYRLPGRVTKAIIVNGLPPLSLDADSVARPVRWLWPQMSPALCRAPWLLRAAIWMGWQFVKSPRHHQRAWQHLLTTCSEADCGMFTDFPEFRAMMEANLHELFQASWHGYADDVCALRRAWGFHLKQIQVPVSFWCGSAGANLSLSAARHMVAAVPRSELRIVEHGGHYLLLNEWEALAAELRSPF